MDYLALLEHSFAFERKIAENPPENRFVYLGDYIFDFTTYDSEMTELFAKRAVEVCAAINNGKTFEYIHSTSDNYTWFLLMCNMSFFAEKLTWGTSIRGAWWEDPIEFKSCGLWEGNEQLLRLMKFNQVEWKLFITAIIEFAGTK